VAALRKIIRSLLKPRGDRRWDILIRATGAIALIGIPIVLYFPQAMPLVWLAIASVPANSPLSPLTPVAFEPLIMEAAKYAAPIAVTCVALSVYMYMEYLNFHLYRWVLNRERLKGLRQKSAVRKSVGYFARAPFVTIVVFAFTPLPFWVARILCIYDGYSVPRFMFATTLGRLPRIYLYAWLGAALSLPTVLLASTAVGATLIVVAWRLYRRRPLLHDSLLDGSDTKPERSEELGEARS
jgi:uncharacterized membrane protein YdjX (TVP38/TMEM64 family)